MRVMFVGDINLGEYYTGFGHGPKSYAATKNVFAGVSEIFQHADFVVGNLEAPITSFDDSSRDPERQVLRASSSSICQLREAGFKLLQVANNHTVQHGRDVFDETLGLLYDEGIRAVGSVGDRQVFEAGGLKVAFYAASDVPDNTDKMQESYQRLDEAFISRVERDVADFDHIIVMLHWGLEESTTPLPYQRKLAKRLKDCGVSAIIGSHTHLFYEVEVGKSFVCAYSLGNFLFDLCWDARMLRSGILDVEFGEKNIRCKLWPVTLTNDGCKPVVTGEAIDLNGIFLLYDHGKKIGWQRMKKTLSFWRNIYKGDSLLKLKFFSIKIIKILGLWSNR